MGEVAAEIIEGSDADDLTSVAVTDANWGKTHNTSPQKRQLDILGGYSRVFCYLIKPTVT